MEDSLQGCILMLIHARATSGTTVTLTSSTAAAINPTPIANEIHGKAAFK